MFPMDRMKKGSNKMLSILLDHIDDLLGVIYYIYKFVKDIKENDNEHQKSNRE